jgi:hypothetical protein
MAYICSLNYLNHLLTKILTMNKRSTFKKPAWLQIAVCAMALVAWMPQAQAQYCIPTFTNPCTSGDFIDAFSFNLISNGGTGCAFPGANNYSDYTAIVDSVQQGQGYTITCAPGPTWGQYFAVWIDFNQDGDFDEVNEFFDIGYSAGGGNIATPITIPNGVPGGTTTMRVLCHFGTGVINQPDACLGQAWGEVEDYTVVVGSPPPYDMSTVSVDGPVTGCGLGIDTVWATFQNNGSVTADTVTLCYSVNGGAWLCDDFLALGLVSQGLYQHGFSDLIDLSTPGDYTIDVAVSQWGDSTGVNDTIWGYLMTSVPTVTGIPYLEDFESGTGGWVPAGTLSTWEHGVPAETNIFSDTTGVCSNNNGWATGLTTPYNNNEASYLESPCIDFSALTADPFLRFDHLFQVEGTFEAHWVETSIDGGATWTLLGANGTGLNWYNQAANWDGVSYVNPGGWRAAQHILAGTAGEADVRIRFAFTADGSVQQEGIAIDNIQIAGSFDDAYAQALSNPVSLCGLTATELVSASFFNNGSDTLYSLPVCYSINGGTPVCETIVDTILPNTAYAYDFAGLADLSVIGDYDFAIWSGLATDGNTCNDTTWAVATNILTVASFPYQEKFENGQGGWTIDNTINGSWDFGTPAKNVIVGAASGANAFVTGGLGTGLYNVNENSYVYGPCFDFTNLPANAWVAMHSFWESENSWDGANLQVSVDTGATWTNIGTPAAPAINSWYNDNSISGGPGGSQEGWTGDVNNIGSNEWVWSKHALDTALMGVPYVQIRVAFGSDGSVTRDGFAFDDFAISVPPTFALGADTVGCGNMIINSGLMDVDFEWLALDTLGNTTVLGNDTWVQLTNPSFADSTFNLIGIYTDSFGLCAADTMMVTLFPAPVVDLMDVSACLDDSVMFGVDTASVYTYAWDNGATTDSTWYPGGSMVMVTVTNTVSGCTGVDSAMVWSTPYVDLGADVEVCAGDSIMLDAGAGYSDFAWSTLDSTQTIMVDQDGTYTVTVIDSIGCSSNDDIVLTVNALPVVNITSDLSDTICVNQSMTLDAGSGFSTYSWSTSGSAATEAVAGSSLTSGQTNTITVDVTDANGCANTASFSIWVDDCVGIDEQVGAYVVSYYPNPTLDFLTVELTGTSNEQLTMTILDLSGRTVHSEQFAAANGTVIQTIDVRELASGIYNLRFEAAGSVLTAKFIVQ